MWLPNTPVPTASPKQQQPANKPAGTSDIVACQSCDDGFKLTGGAGADNTACIATQYTCPANGTAKTGSPSGTADQVVCERCNDGFKLAAPSGGTIGDPNTTCVATQYTCPANGTAKTGSPSGTADQVVCERCNDGFKLAAPSGGTIGDPNTTCAALTYTCSNGAPADGAPTTGTADVESCKSCDSGYALTSATPQTCALDTDGDGTPNIEDTDSDGDGVLDTDDSCPTGVTGWTSNSNTDKNNDGCRDSAITSATTIGHGSVGITLSGINLFGVSVASLGDLSGDGITVAVGASWNDNGGGSNRGALYLLNLDDDGSLSQLLTKIDSTTTPTLSLSNGAYFGTSVVSLGDLDGTDGVDVNGVNVNGVRTVAVGSGFTITATANGVVRLLTLDKNGDILNVETINKDTTLVDSTDTLGLVANANLFGTSLANLGYLDGSGAGVLTLAVGDRIGNASTNKGALYLLNLNASGGILSSTRIAGTITDGTTTFTLANNDEFGRSVANLGDLDGTGSGATTIAVGAWGDDASGTDRGALYLLNLDSAGDIVGVSKIDDTTTLAGSSTDAFTLANNGGFGVSVANLGDLDGSGSGATTVAVGAHRDDTGGADRGAIYLLNLNSSGGVVGVVKMDDATTLTNGTTDALALTNLNQFGSSVTGVDFNKDAALDALLVGAFGTSSEGGAVHVLHLGEIDW